MGRPAGEFPPGGPEQERSGLPSEREIPGAREAPDDRRDQFLVHFYRAEISRSDRWRTRLDTTTNWAFTAAAALVSFTFARPENPHAFLLVGIYLVFSFLLLESRRYRYYDLWIRRVRLLEAGILAPLLRHEDADPDALRELANELSEPRLYLDFWTALALRLQRTYGPLFILLFIAWPIKVAVDPVHVNNASEFLDHARVGFIKGGWVIGLYALTLLFFFAVLSWSRFTRLPRGEILPRQRRVTLREAFRL